MVNFYLCEACRNLVEMVYDAGVTPVCCGHPMTELIPNTTEAAGEKHLPVVSQEGDTIRVCVGSAAHPMSTEHSIQWICLESAEGCQLKKLSPDTAPETEFSLTQGDAPKAAYAYCNLHGLWKTEF